MFARAGGHWQREELSFLRSVRPVPVLKRLLLENQLGAPYITSLSMLSSHNTIHHLYHLLRYEHVMKQPLSAIRSVVEFGGGYGNLARLASKLDMGGTYTIIDLPILSCIQLIYLSTILGRERIHVVSEDRDIAPQRVNLVPLPYIGRLRSLTCELFISTWALSECTESAQRYVTDRQFFSARRLLLAYQVENEIFGSPEHCVSESSKLFRVFRERIAFMPEAYYLFA
jgi:putative sugar O-methyltransferase